MKIELANRIRELPPYLFARIDALKNEERKKGKDLIDLGIGDPDLPTHRAHRGGACRGGADPAHPPLSVVRGDGGLPQGRRRVHEVALRPHVRSGKEVICVIGSKEAIAHFPFAFVNPGDMVLLPRPRLSGLRHADPLRRRRALLRAAASGRTASLPDLDAIPAEVAKRAKILWINYPNNPTAALAAPRLLREGRRLRQEERHHRRQRSGLQRDVLRGAAAVVPRDARRHARSASSSTRCRRPTT